jgi:beta-phosphoglucomutase-like phosphatase (HAD superfamily)
MPSNPSRLQAVIFDMDGILIDSEPFWREAEIEVFGRNGLRLTEADCMLTTGMRIGEVTRYWYERRPWKGLPPDILAGEILEGVIRRVGERGTAMPGSRDAIRLFQGRGLRLALASSSAVSLIDSVIDHLELRSFFEVICSAENEPRGKPHPDVYLSAAARLGLLPQACLAVEDSIAGMQAAKAAGMRCIAVPLPELRADARYNTADLILDSLVQLDEEVLKSLMGE